MVQRLVHAFCVFVQPLKVKLDLGEVHFVTNADPQAKFGLIFNLGLVSSLRELTKPKLKINGQTLPHRHAVTDLGFLASSRVPNLSFVYRNPTNVVVLKGKLLVYML